MNMNNGFQVIGRVGADPELKEVNNTHVMNVSLAVNHQRKNEDGEKEEHTEWFRVAIWGKLAESLSKIVKKGQLVAVDGVMNVKTKEDEHGVKNSRIVLNGRNLRILYSKNAQQSMEEVA